MASCKSTLAHIQSSKQGWQITYFPLKIYVRISSFDWSTPFSGIPTFIAFEIRVRLCGGGACQKFRGAHRIRPSPKVWNPGLSHWGYILLNDHLHPRFEFFFTKGFPFSGGTLRGRPRCFFGGGGGAISSASGSVLIVFPFVAFSACLSDLVAFFSMEFSAHGFLRFLLCSLISLFRTRWWLLWLFRGVDFGGSWMSLRWRRRPALNFFFKEFIHICRAIKISYYNGCLL